MLRRHGRGAVLAVVAALSFSACAGPPSSDGGTAHHAARASRSATNEAAVPRLAPPPGDRAIAPPPPDFGGAAPAASTCAAPPPPVAPSGTGTWAVIIGINRYPSGHFDLQSAVPDARDVDEALGRFGVPPGQRLVMTDESATGCRIDAAADWLVRNAGPAATAVFFYAGHARKLGGSTEALIAADGANVTDADLAHHLAGLQSAHTWIGISACFGGGFDELLGPGRILTAAAGPNALAYENEGFHRSYLVQYMVRKAMIEGAAPDTVQQSYQWAWAALDRDYPNRMPYQIDRAGGPLDIHQPGAPRPPATSHAVAGGGRGGSSNPPPAPPPTSPSTTAPPPNDNCSGLTLGIVHCR